MIRALVDFALNNKFVVLATAVLLIGWGAISFHNLPVEAYPDIADNYVTVITQWPGRSAEEVEQQVTIPIEIQMAGMPHMTYLRSESIFGLSFVIMIFDDSSVNDWNRQKVLERLTQVNLPAGAEPAAADRNRLEHHRTDLLVHAAQHESPLRPDGAALHRGFGAAEAAQVGSERGGCFGFRRHGSRVPGAGGPEQVNLVRLEHRSTGAAAIQQQHQCRRQLCRDRNAADERTGAGVIRQRQGHRANGAEDPDGNRTASAGYGGGGAGSQDPAGTHGTREPHGGRAHYRRARRDPGRRADAEGSGGGADAGGDSQESR